MSQTNGHMDTNGRTAHGVTILAGLRGSKWVGTELHVGNLIETNRKVAACKPTPDEKIQLTPNPKA